MPIRYQILFVFLIFLLGPVRIRAQFAGDFNHPELTWRVLETGHFRIYYHQGLEGLAGRAAGIAEEAYGPITGLYGFEPDEKVRIVLRDTDDYANGQAYYYHNAIVIWATNLDFELRGTTDWLHNVITHEFGHIVSLQVGRKGPRRVPALYFHLFGYQSEGRRDDVLTGYPNLLVSYAVPMTMIPPWYAEGTAQYMASGVHYDRWDAHRDMILRMATLNGTLLTYDEMNAFGAKTGLGFEKVYDHGYSLVLFIVNTFGEDKLVQIYRKMAVWWQVDFGSAIQEALGISGRELRRRWVESLEERYRVQKAGVMADPAEGEIVRSSGYLNLHPKWSPGGARMAYLSNAGSDYGRTNLFVFNPADSTQKLVAAGATSAFDWSPDGSRILFSRRSRPDRYGSRFWDLYTVDPGAPEKGALRKFAALVGLPSGTPPGETRLSHGLRATYPVFSPDGTSIAFVKNGGGNTNLGVMDVRSGEIRYLTQFDDGSQVFSPAWSPDGMRIAFSLYCPGDGRSIAVVPAAGGAWDYLAASSGTDRDPCWTPDGNGLVFASDFEGIFDIYHLDLSDRAVHRITRVLGGAFQPHINPKDGRIVFSYYGAGGYEIRTIDGRGLWQPVDPDAFRPPVAPSPVPPIAGEQAKSPESRPYKNAFGVFTLFPRLAVDAGKLKLGFFGGSDELTGKQALFVGGTVSHDLDVDLFGIYAYRRWRPTLFLEAYRQTRHVEEDVVNRDYNFRIYNRNFSLNEIDLGLKYRMRRGDRLDARLIYSRYGWSIDQSSFNGLNRSSVDATYLNGFDFAFTYRRNTVPPALDSEINPRSGRDITLRYDRFYNFFLKDFAENTSLLIERYNRYPYSQITLDWAEYLPAGPGRSALGLRFYGGLMGKTVNDDEANGFFDFHLGGLPYLKGYTYYSLEGSRAAMFRAAYRFPIWTGIARQTGPIYSDQIYGSVYAGIGRAWDGNDMDGTLKRGWKRDVGAQVRYEGISFYLFPTRISLDVAYGLDTVPLVEPGDPARKGGVKFYFTLLFGYLQSVGG